MTTKTSKLRITFKRDSVVRGLAGVAYSDIKRSSDIKVNGKVVGSIYNPTCYALHPKTAKDEWIVMLYIEREGKAKNITLKKRWMSLDDAKTDLKEYWAQIAEHYQFREMD